MTYILIFILSIITVIGIRYVLNHNRIIGSLTCVISVFGIFEYPSFLELKIIIRHAESNFLV